MFFKARNRFFFGCFASTAENPCPGSKEWQSTDVPKDLRVIPSSASTAQSHVTEARKREADEADPSDAPTPCEKAEVPEGKHVKRESS